MPKEILMTIVGKNLKHYRIMRHITQVELAEKAGVSVSFCANVECGKKGVSMFVLRDFADALHITVNQLLYDHVDNQRIEPVPETFRITCDKPSFPHCCFLLPRPGDTAKTHSTQR